MNFVKSSSSILVRVRSSEGRLLKRTEQNTRVASQLARRDVGPSIAYPVVDVNVPTATPQVPAGTATGLAVFLFVD